MPAGDGTVLFENAHIIFRNFQGKESQYNREGDRNFCVVLTPETAEEMVRDGWNVKQTRARDDEAGDHYIQVSIGYKYRAPNVFMVTTRGRTALSESELELLDYADFENVDLIVRPYEWTIGGRSGITAYLQTLYVTIREDYLMQKYADVPMSGESEEI